MTDKSIKSSSMSGEGERNVSIEHCQQQENIDFHITSLMHL